MSPKRNIIERRKHNRFGVEDGVTVEFLKPRFFKLGKPRVIKSARMIDISLEGLAFEYVDQNMWSPNFNELSIKKVSGATKLDRLPFKALSDFSTYKLPNAMQVRRCGAKFGQLTQGQQKRLRYFIQDHAISSYLAERRSGEDRRRLNVIRYDVLDRREGAERRQVH